jgi:hypothetical protein
MSANPEKISERREQKIRKCYFIFVPLFTSLTLLQAKSLTTIQEGEIKEFAVFVDSPL